MTIIRLLAPLLVLQPLSACDRTTPPAAPPEPQPTATPTPQEASQSIMQPQVIAETKAPPVPLPTPEPTSLPNITIAFASGAALDDAGRAALDALLDDPAVPDNARFVLRGSSDTLGSDAANLATSRRRARAVRSYLLDKGVAADRVTVIALGEHRPVAPNVTLSGEDDPAGRARNRRVDIEVLPPDAEPAEGQPTGDDPPPPPAQAASGR